jgi:hypothetical protein
MKRILQAIGVAGIAAMPHASFAFDADMALDRFPSVGGRAAANVQVYREGRIGDSRKGTGHGYRDGPFPDSRRTYRDDRRGREWGGAPEWRESRRYRSSGSVIDVRTFGGAVERGSFYGTAGTANSSFMVIGTPDTNGAPSSVFYGGMAGGAKILDVEADRLDRRPYGRDGLAVAHVGTAKIIRISPDFQPGMGREAAEREASGAVETPFADLRPEERAVSVYPDTDMAERPIDPPAPRVAQSAPPAVVPAPAPAPPMVEAPSGFLEPWTPDWLRDCVARHADFDASLGTYTAADGKRRFCTGEP